MGTAYQASVEQAIGITDSGSENLYDTVVASSVLNLIGTAVPSIKALTASHSLSLTQSISQPISFPVVDDPEGTTLSLLHYAEVGRPRPVSVSTAIALVQSALSNMHGRSVTSAIGLSHSASTGKAIPVSRTDYMGDLSEYGGGLGIRDAVSLRRSVTNVSIQHYLNLSDRGAKTVPLAAHSGLSLSDQAYIAHEGAPSQTITLTHSVQVSHVDSVTSISHALGVTQTVVATTVRDLVITHTVVLDDRGLWLGSANDKGIYDPSYADDSVTNIIPSSYAANTGSVVLTYPRVSPEHTVTLRAPLFNNNETLHFGMITRRDRGGKLDQYRRNSWPKQVRFRMDFADLSWDVRNGLHALLRSSLGKEIGLVDNEGRSWRGLVLTPDSQVREDKRDRGNAVTLEFEVEQV